MNNRDYMLTLRIPINAFDDPDFRAKAKELIEKAQVPENIEVKLQEIYDFQPPRKVNY